MEQTLEVDMSDLFERLMGQRWCLICLKGVSKSGLELEARNREVRYAPGVHPFIGSVHWTCVERQYEAKKEG